MELKELMDICSSKENMDKYATKIDNDLYTWHVENTINHALVRQQNVSPQNITRIVVARVLMDFIFGIEKVEAEDKNSYVDAIQELEYYMQDAWGFGEDITKHTY